MLIGCAATNNGSGPIDKTLQALGLQAPPPLTLDSAADAVPRVNLPPAAKKVTLRLHAGTVLNTDPNGQSLSIVARIYKLRGLSTFERAPYAAFEELKPLKMPELASDIVDVREVVLTPGQQYDVIETVGPEAPYLAVVALFRAPAQPRWRFIFDTQSAATTGITIGLHGCALSVSAGLPLNSAPETLRVAGVQCPSS